MLKFGVIGIGACGNSIANQLANLDVAVYLVNTEEQDIAGIGASNLPSFTFGTAGGCGQNRAEAIKLVKENWQDFCLAIPKGILESDVVYVIESTSGGTGSGMGVIITELLTKKYGKSIHFGMIPVYDTGSDKLLHLANSVMFHNELSGLADRISYMPYDNGRIDGSLKEVHRRINDCIIDDLSLLSGIHLKSTDTNIDKRDLTTLVMTTGMKMVIKIDDVDHRTLEKESVSDLILNGIKNSYHLDIDFEKQGLKYLGVIYDLPKTALDMVKSDYRKATDRLGMPITTFEHMQESTSDSGCIIAILAGLPVPESKIADIAKRVEAQNEKMSMVQTNNVGALKNKVSWLTGMNNPQSSVKEEDISDDLDFMGKY